MRRSSPRSALLTRARRPADISRKRSRIPAIRHRQLFNRARKGCGSGGRAAANASRLFLTEPRDPARRDPGHAGRAATGDRRLATSTDTDVTGVADTGRETAKAPHPPVPRPPGRHRRSDFDVTNTVQVSSFAAVARACEALFRDQWPGESFDPLHAAFNELRRLFAGEWPGYSGLDTVYHDRQHTLDMTLAAARLLVGYERSVAERDRLGWERAAMGLVTALFHDSGYVRESADPRTETARRSPRATSVARRGSSRAACRRSASAPGSRSRRASFTTRGTRSRLRRSRSTIRATGRSAT